MDHHPCLHCGQVRGEVLFTGMDRLHRATEMSFAVIRCSACGLVYTSPRLSGHDLAVYYPPGVYYAYASRQPGTSLVWRFRRGALASVLERRHGFPRAANDRLVQPLRSMSAAILRSRYMGYPAYVPGARILDVGCGDGQFLRQMRDYGFDCWGVEIDGGAVERARMSGLNVHQGSLERLQSMEQAFDVIRFSQVLEHLPDPGGALGNAFRLLKPDGELILLLPNFASLLSRLFREHWFHLDLPRHLIHFTPDSIRRFLRSAGFDRVRVIRYTAEHSITGTLRYWLEGKRGSPAVLRSLLNGSVVRVALIPLVVGAGMVRVGDLMEVRAQKPV